MARARKPLLFALLAALLLALANGQPASFRFVIVGDRTGEAQPGVYEQVWREFTTERPAFAITVGDTIQGLNDGTAAAQWKEVQSILKPYRKFPIYFTPGNHDIWSAASERLYQNQTGRPPRYSFDHSQAHFAILDNSRSEAFSAEDLAFLEKDLKSHANQAVKFIFSHRPSWLVSVALQNPNDPVHQLARTYGVQYIVAGHVHQMLHLELQGVTYVSVPSSGGHLRNSKKYEDGWFFGYSVVEVRGTDIDFRIQELKPPRGKGRVTKLKDWGMLGLKQR